MAERVFTNEYIEDELEISEMVADAPAIVSLNRNRVQELLDAYEDTEPDDKRFVVLRIEGGLSKNKFNYSDSVMRDVAEQVSQELPGYFGHVAKEDRSWKFPEPETLWLGAKATTENGKAVLYAKGYLVPGTKSRRHVRSKVVKTAPDGVYIDERKRMMMRAVGE
jgi:hypothetical protein